MVNNLVFRWPKPLFFMVLRAHGGKQTARQEVCGVMPFVMGLELSFIADGIRSSSENFRLHGTEENDLHFVSVMKDTPKHHPLTCGEPGSLGHLFDRLETRLVDMNQVAKRWEIHLSFPKSFLETINQLGVHYCLKK